MGSENDQDRVRRGQAPGSGVNPERSKRLVTMLRRTIQAHEAGNLTREIRFSPGCFVPEDTSILDPIVPGDEDPADTAVVIGLEVVRDELVVQEPEPDNELLIEDGVEQIEPNLTMIQGLRRFAAEATQQQSWNNVTDFALRRALSALPSDEALVEAIEQGLMDAARSLIVDRQRTLISLALDIQGRLAARTNPTGGTRPEEGVLHQLKLQIDQVLTASAQRLPHELHTFNVEAGAQRRAHDEASKVFERSRGELLALVRLLTTSVAELGMSYQAREDLSLHDARIKGLGEQSDRLRATLLEALAQAQEAEERLRELRDLSHQTREQARRLVNQLRSFLGAARLLGSQIPHEIEAQIQRTTDPIELLLREGSSAVMEVITPDWDAKIEKAFGQIVQERHRATHMLHPIRPSVFRRRLDRMEELRRLALIAYHVTTRGRKDPGDKARPHRGYGKSTVSHYVLLLADLIDQSETGLCQDQVYRLNHHGDIERGLRERLRQDGHTRITKSMITAAVNAECGPELLEKNRIGKGWYYRPNEQGQELAEVWLSECLDPEDLCERIMHALKAYSAQRFKERRSSPPEDHEQEDETES